MPDGRRALITGIAGQDGSFLAELLLEKGYEVTGMQHAGASSLGASDHLGASIQVLDGELLEPASLRAAIEAARPDELYHLAGMSYVPGPWEAATRAIEAIAGATATVLESVRELDRAIRVF